MGAGSPKSRFQDHSTSNARARSISSTSPPRSSSIPHPRERDSKRETTDLGSRSYSPQKPATNRFIAQAMAVNPVLLLDEIATGATAATKTGTEVVLHVPLTNYRVTVNLRRALARVSGPYARAERIAIKQQLKALRHGRSSVHFNVRTDGAGFVRHLETTVPGSKLGRINLTLSGYGSTVNIKQPQDRRSDRDHLAPPREPTAPTLAMDTRKPFRPPQRSRSPRSTRRTSGRPIREFAGDGSGVKVSRRRHPASCRRRELPLSCRRRRLRAELAAAEKLCR